MSINPYPEFEQQYIEDSTPDREKIEPRFFYNAIASEPDRKIIQKLLQVNFADARELEEASELSRSAALNRADKLVEAGIVVRQIKPGTENRNKPPYIFSLNTKTKTLLGAMLKDRNAENEFEMNDRQVVDTSAIERLNFSQDTQKLNSEKDLKQNPVLQTTPKVNAADENSSSLEKRIGLILTEMAKEIAALRSRIADIEEKLEQNPQNTDQFDFDNILNILENTQNGKDTS